MKKLLNTALIYAIAAMVGGVFYREFTKFNGFTGKTTLLALHPHLFLLGMVMFILAALFCMHCAITESRKFKPFYTIYNIGMVITATTFLARGIPQVLELPLSKGLDASISGIAGIGHILVATGLILFLLILKEKAVPAQTKITA